MSKYVELTFCELPNTPYGFDVTKFKAGDSAQIKLYKDSKVPRRKKTLTYEQIEEDDSLNFARVVPEGCMFIDFDNSEEADEMREIIIHSGLRCLILETTHGYHFLFRVPPIGLVINLTQKAQVLFKLSKYVVWSVRKDAVGT